MLSRYSAFFQMGMTASSLLVSFFTKNFNLNIRKQQADVTNPKAMTPRTKYREKYLLRESNWIAVP